MMPYTASAPGKIILFGEHAVVYGQPALAVPVHKVRAEATVTAGPAGSGLVIEASNLNLRLSMAESATNPLAATARLVLERLDQPEPDATISIRSSIPIAGGLGSGAAVSAALARALSAYLGNPIDPAPLSDLVFEIERFHHGTPSGIDNTVICYGQPVYFIRGTAPEIFRVGRAFHLIIADTGVASPTRAAVAGVRARWEQHRQTYDKLFADIGQVSREARWAIETGDLAQLGPLMLQNQQHLRAIGVSSAEIEGLMSAALSAGAQGAKLSGGGCGGNMIALAPPDQAVHIGDALQRAGATRVIHTVIE
jgi:mevalonate kinase